MTCLICISLVFCLSSYGLDAFQTEEFYCNPIDDERVAIGDIMPENKYENGEKIAFVPPAPQRGGLYICGGYKEAECENAWGFGVVPLRLRRAKKRCDCLQNGI